MRSGHAARAITYHTGLTLHEAKEDMRSRTPVLRARTLEITNAESAARMAHRTKKTGSAGLPFRRCQYRAKGKITQNRIAKIPHRLAGGIPVGFTLRIPEMTIAPIAGPNAPMTPISIRYVGFFTDAANGTAHTIQEQAKATIKNAMIGCFRIRSGNDCRIMIPEDSFTPVHLSFFKLSLPNTSAPALKP